MARRRGRSMRWRAGVVSVWLGLGVATLLCADPAVATLRFGDVQISGNFDTVNLVRHPNIHTAQFIQNRNTFRLRFDYEWLKKGELIGKYDIPFVKSSKLYFLYRGVYDGFYDIAPGGRQRGVTRFDDMVGGPIEGNLIGTCRDVATGALRVGDECGANTRLRDGLYSRFNDNRRDAEKFENEFREIYIDLDLEDLPVSLRIGRQQVIWGESDQFRLMDIWNPLDLTWHLQQEPFTEIRVPLWLIKGLWDIGRLGPISNAFLEVVYNPFDFQSGAQHEFLPQPWALPFPNPVRQGQVQVTSSDTFFNLITPDFDLQGTGLRNGDFQKNPEDASEIGWRFHGVTRQGFEFTINYLYGRGRSIGAFAGQPFALDIESITVDTTVPLVTADGSLVRFANLPLSVSEADVKAKFNHPYTHIFGVTGNYFEGDWTQAVLRMEMAYQMDAPVQTIDPDFRVRIKDPRGSNIGPRSPLGATKRDLWSGMLGFDRPTWIKPLNERATWFISGQFFWSYVNGAVNDLKFTNQIAGADPYFTPEPGSCPTCGPAGDELIRNDGVGVWNNGPFAGQVERIQDASFDGNADDVRRWELLTTLAFTSFYKGGTVVPFIALSWDPVNMNFLSQTQIEWFYTNSLVFTLQQKFYSRFGNGVSLDPWGVGGLNHRRDETGLKVTFQF